MNVDYAHRLDSIKVIIQIPNELERVYIAIRDRNEHYCIDCVSIVTYNCYTLLLYNDMIPTTHYGDIFQLKTHCTLCWLTTLLTTPTDHPY